MPLGWTREDIQTLYQFLGDVKELLRTGADLTDYRDVLLSECDTARQALHRIGDAITT